MKNLLTWLSKRRFPYQPLISVNISRENLLHNLSQFKTLAPSGLVAPVLKSNAYGHGLIEIAGILDTEKTIPFMVVDSYFEAVALKSAGIRTPLLIIGYTRPETLLTSHFKNVAFALTSLETLRQLSQAPRPIHVHLKIDTGMHRQGILPEEVPEAMQLIKANPRLILEGVCSHLCDADNPDHNFTHKQIAIWNSLITTLKKEFPTLKHIHLSATDGHMFGQEIQATVSRLGLGLYGLTENTGLQQKLSLKPVMEVKTIISGIKQLKAGETIGYGNTFKAPHDMTVATIPFGYFEGLDRRLSNKGTLLVGENRHAARIVGKVSMNISSIDVSNLSAHVGDEVVVFSSNPADPNSIHSMVKVVGEAIPYEMIVRIPEHLKRVVV